MERSLVPGTFLHGERMSWAQAPPGVTDWVEARLGSRVARWDDRSGGMSTGIACVVTGEDARSLFVKAVNGSENPFALQLVTREAESSARLPDLPGVPRVLDAGEVLVADDVWWAMITPAAPGRAARHPGAPRSWPGCFGPGTRSPSSCGHTMEGLLPAAAVLHGLERARRRPRRSVAAAGHLLARSGGTARSSSPAGRPTTRRCCRTSTCGPTTSCCPRRGPIRTCGSSTGPTRDWPPAGWTWPCCWPTSWARVPTPARVDRST